MNHSKMQRGLGVRKLKVSSNKSLDGVIERAQSEGSFMSNGAGELGESITPVYAMGHEGNIDICETLLERMRLSDMSASNYTLLEDLVEDEDEDGDLRPLADASAGRQTSHSDGMFQDSNHCDSSNSSLGIDDIALLNNVFSDVPDNEAMTNCKKNARYTVADESFSDLSYKTINTKQCGEKGRRGSIADYPEVAMLMQELYKRVATLESMIGVSSSSSTSAANANINTSIPEIPKFGESSGIRKIPALKRAETMPASLQDQNEAVIAAMTTEQKQALDGLSSNVKGLIHCLNHRHHEQQNKILSAIEESDDSDEEDGIDYEDSYHSQLSKLAEKKSRVKVKLLKSVMGPSAEQIDDLNVRKKVGKMGGGTNKSKKKARNTVFSTNQGMQSLGSLQVPKELIMNMLGRVTESGQNVFSAAYLANEYGGVQLPRRLLSANSGGQGTQKRTLKQFVKAVECATSFVGQVKVQVGKDDVEYLPREFMRLELNERKRLAKVLSWDSLKLWGFDSFEVEKLSSITLFRRGSVNRCCGLTPANEEENDAYKVENSKRGCPIVLIGWALLASPYSQLAMAKNVNDEELIETAMRAIRQRANTVSGPMARLLLEGIDDGFESKLEGSLNAGSKESNEVDGKVANGASSDEKATGVSNDDAWNGGYFLPDVFQVAPRPLCRFLRNVEKEYNPRDVNPYHNNIHAADVIQSTHALIQMGGADMELAYTPLEIYSILLAAALHDIRHPGTNNNYQVNKRSKWTLIYNDVSVLENMHASRACHLLEGIDDKNRCEVSGSSSRSLMSTTDNGECGGEVKPKPPDIFGTMSKDQQTSFRSSLVKSILSTDMSHHFWSVAKMSKLAKGLEDEIAKKSPSSINQSFLSNIGGEKHVKLRDKFLPFLLHLADISNPTKAHDVSLEWANCVYDEFFLQGDKEREEEMPISPLCDKSTTDRSEAQVGFMTFVIKPAFDLLARCIPNVGDLVLKQLDENIIYWEKEKAREKTKGEGAAAT